MAIQTDEKAEGEPVSEINTTPLIDVMLVLLIMLIVTLPAQHHGVKLDTPCATCNLIAPPPSDPILIAIDFDGSFSWNGVPLDAAALDRRLAMEARRAEQPEIHIEPHRSAKYGYVVHVMAAAQREGLTKLGVVG